MAAVVGNVLVGKVFELSEAEAAFQTWWDKAKDFMVYGLVMLGKKFSFHNISTL